MKFVLLLLALIGPGPVVGNVVVPRHGTAEIVLTAASTYDGTTAPRGSRTRSTWR